MCDGKIASRKQNVLLMTGLKSYESSSGQPPSKASAFVTGLLFLLLLIISEQSMRAIFYLMKDLHPILENETNRFILARHIGIDFLSCFTVAVLGWKARAIAWDMVTAALGGKNAMAPAGFEQRMFTYHPASFRIALVFFVFQVKNLYDTIVWNDGPEFIFHHLASMLASYGALYPSFAHFYGIFYLGLSEISTAVLCVLANFDDEHGVVGLGDAFPVTKVIVGAIFVTLFILCRTIMWPIATYYFMRDANLALKGSGDRLDACKGWMKLFMVSCTGLSILQVLWLGQIFIIAKKEFEALGLL